MNAIHCTSDMYYQIVTQSLSVVESNTVSITADLSCSFSGVTSIAYTVNYFSYILKINPN